MSSISSATKQTLLNEYRDCSALAYEKHLLNYNLAICCAITATCLVSTIIFSGLVGGLDSSAVDIVMRKKMAVMGAIVGCSMGGLLLMITAYFFYKRYQFEHQKLTDTQVEAIRANEKCYVNGAKREVAAIKRVDLDQAYSLVELSKEMQKAFNDQNNLQLMSQTTRVLKHRQTIMKLCLALVASFLLIAIVATIIISQEKNLSQDLIKGAWLASGVLSAVPLLNALGIFISTRVKSSWGKLEKDRMEYLNLYLSNGGRQIEKATTEQQMTRGAGNAEL